MHKLPKLPYTYGALSPYIDKRTMQIHHSKHHAGYVNNLNTLLKDYPKLSQLSVDDLLINSKNLPKNIKVNCDFKRSSITV